MEDEKEVSKPMMGMIMFLAAYAITGLIWGGNIDSSVSANSKLIEQFKENIESVPMTEKELKELSSDLKEMAGLLRDSSKDRYTGSMARADFDASQGRIDAISINISGIRDSLNQVDYHTKENKLRIKQLEKDVDKIEK